MPLAGRQIVWSLAVGLLSLSAVSPARAADADTERARSLYEEAGELERRGQWVGAQDKLRSALRLRETPQLRYALGWALENDEKLLEAKVEYQSAARTAREVVGAEEAARLAAARLADLAQQVPVLKIRVRGASKRNARVVIDGREIARDDESATASVNPGSHVIRVERAADGVSLNEQVVYVGRSTVRTVDVELDEPVTQRNSLQDRHERAPSSGANAAHGSSIVPWLLLSGGLAGLAGGATLLVSSASDGNTRDAMQARWCAATACTGTRATLAESPQAVVYREAASDAAHAGNTKQALGFTIGGAGVIATAVGTVLLLRSNDRPNEKAEAHPRIRASVAPTFGGGFASASLSF